MHKFRLNAPSGIRRDRGLWRLRGPHLPTAIVLVAVFVSSRVRIRRGHWLGLLGVREELWRRRIVPLHGVVVGEILHLVLVAERDSIFRIVFTPGGLCLLRVASLLLVVLVPPVENLCVFVHGDGLVHDVEKDATLTGGSCFGSDRVFRTQPLARSSSAGAKTGVLGTVFTALRRAGPLDLQVSSLA